MAWLLPAIVGTLCGTLVLLLVYIYLYYEYHERYLAIWAVGWGVTALRFGLQLAGLYSQTPLFFGIGEQVMALLSGFLLLWGIYAFLGKPMPGWWAVGLIAGTLWIVVGSIGAFPFLLLTIPTFTFLGLITILAGLLLLRQKEVTGFPPRLAGGAFILWGLHRLDFPLLRPVLWFAPWGFLLAAVFQITAALGIILTYFQRNRQELHRSEGRLRLLVEQMPVMVNAFDADWRIIFWNRECERVTGYSAAEVIGDPQVMTLVYPDDAYRQTMMARWQALGNNYRGWEWDFTCKDGRVRTIAWSNISDQFPIPGWAFWGIGVDVTERKQAEAVLRQTQKMESLGVLAGGIAHDFNNLLTVIMAQTSLASRKLEAHHPARENLEHTLAASERAADLTRHMLAFSGKGHFEIRPLNLNDLVQANLPLIRAGLSKQIELQADLTAALPLLEGDVGQLQQVVMNLILNGAQAIADRPGIVRVSTNSRDVPANGEEERDYLGTLLAPGRYVSLTVTDNGQGIDDATMSHIFEPFFSTKESGYGLGLAAVLGIVQGHKGGIFIRSKVGEGTTFSVLLPTISDMQSMPEADITLPTPTAVDGLVLVIDDEESIRRVIGDILAADGIDSLAAATGQEALVLFQAHQAKIRLVMLDLSMPGMGGMETFVALRHINKDIPILLSSGYSQTEVSRQWLEEPPVGFVAKPYQVQTLLTAVRRQLSARPTHDQPEDTPSGEDDDE